MWGGGDCAYVTLDIALERRRQLCLSGCGADGSPAISIERAQDIMQPSPIRRQAGKMERGCISLYLIPPFSPSYLPASTTSFSPLRSSLPSFCIAFLLSFFTCFPSPFTSFFSFPSLTNFQHNLPSLSKSHSKTRTLGSVPAAESRI